MASIVTPLVLSLSLSLSILISNLISYAIFVYSKSLKHQISLPKSLGTTWLTILWQHSIQRIERYILRQTSVVHHVSVTPLSLLSVTLISNFKNRDQIEFVDWPYNTYSKEVFFSSLKWSIILPNDLPYNYKLRVFFFSYENSRHQQRLEVQKHGWIFFQYYCH